MTKSNCCGAVMFNYPDDDHCPFCHEHCISEEEQDLEDAFEKLSDRLDDDGNLIA